MHVCAPDKAARRKFDFGVDSRSPRVPMGYGSRAPLKKIAHFDWTDFRITRRYDAGWRPTEVASPCIYIYRS